MAKKNLLRVNLNLIKTPEYEGYFYNSLWKWMEEHGVEKEWIDYIAGSTVGVYRGKAVVYKKVVDKFLRMAKLNED